MNMDLSVLDAWIDGEPVSRNEVAALLATDEGRIYAVDVMALRRVMHFDVPVQVTTPASRWRPLVAAAAILLMTAGGFVAGHYATRTERRPEEIVHPASTASAPAPAPTRVIQLEVGVDWNETSGGN